jgi:hypothetical protein
MPHGTRVASDIAMDGSTPLRFVQAGRLDTPAGGLGDAVLVSQTGATLGKLDGMVINPTEHQVCYYVVKSRSWFTMHRYLVPATFAQVEPQGHTLRVDVEPEDLARLPETDPQHFPIFSDMDVVDAMFAPRPH